MSLIRLILMSITLAVSGPALAQQQTPSAAGPSAAGVLERVEGYWIEGPGFEVTYGGDYEGCSQRCVSNPKCVMIEYYKPEKKCNLYANKRPQIKGGSSIVGIRRSN